MRWSVTDENGGTESGLIRANSRARTWTYMVGKLQPVDMRRTVSLLTAAMVVLAALIGGVGSVAAATDAGTASPGPDVAASETTVTENTTTDTESNETTTTTSDAGDDSATETENDSNATVASGSKLAGIIGAQQAEHRSTVETQAVDIALNRTDSNDTRATILADRTGQLRDRLQALQNASDRLEARYENGTISHSAYAGQITALDARIRALERQVNQTRTHSRSLPEPALVAHGLNQSELATLENRTRTVANPHAAAIAKQVAGPDVGRSMGPPDGVPGRNSAAHNPGNGQADPGAPGAQAGNGDRSNRSENATRNTAGNRGPPENVTVGQAGARNETRTDETNNSAARNTIPTATPADAGPNVTEHRRDGEIAPGHDRAHNGSGPTDADDHPVFGSVSVVDTVIGYLG